MSLVKKLTITNLKKNKKRSIVTMLGVALSGALILAIATMGTSFWRTLIDFNIASYGDFHHSFEHIPGDKLDIVEQAYGVESYFYAKDIELEGKYAYLDNTNTPLPSELYTRIDELSESDRTSDKKYIVFVKYSNLKRHERYGKDIGYALDDAGVEGYITRVNDTLIMLEGNIDYNTATILASLITLLLGVIIIASIFTIRNSFNISTTERIREFGMLSSVGATPRQIRRIVITEALIIGACAVPVATILGLSAAGVLLLVTNSLINVGQSFMHFFVPWWVILANAALCFLIVWLASASAAIRAGRLSPIDAIRSSQDVKVKNNKIKTSRFVQSYFGIGGVIASKNLKRSRQKYRTTVISIVVSVAIFVGLSSFVTDSKRIVNEIFPNLGADYIVTNGEPKDYRELIKKFGFDDYVYYQDAATVGDQSVTLLSKEYFEKYARSVGVTEDFDKAVILNDYVTTQHSNGAMSLSRQTEYTDGDKAEIQMYDQDNPDGELKKIELTIAKVTNKYPMGTEVVYRPNYYVSEDYYKAAKLEIPDGYSSLFINPGDRIEELDAYIQEKSSDVLNNIDLNTDEIDVLVGFNIKASLEQTEKTILLASIFMYGFIAVVTLIGVTNIFNTITTNIQLRAKEFAMLKSIGMTDDEFNRMIRLETFFYTFRALIIGLPIGIIISFGAHTMLSEGGLNLSYELPLVPMLIAIVIVTALIAFIMRYSVRQVSKQNIIETIRQDTV